MGFWDRFRKKNKEAEDIAENSKESAVEQAEEENGDSQPENEATSCEMPAPEAAEPKKTAEPEPVSMQEEAAEPESIAEPELAAEPEAAAEPEPIAEPAYVPEPKPVYAPEQASEAAPEVQKKKPGFFSKFFNNLFSTIDDDFYEELEEQLIIGDMGVYATEELLDNLRDDVALNKIHNPQDAKEFLIKDIKRIMAQPEGAYDFEETNSVVMLIGVNGVGKTTCIGKLASQYIARGKKVIMAGADTFRAAAMDQLKVWAERTGCFMVSGNEGADPGSVVFDAAKSAKARGADILLCDTAGRLHNKKNLMNELAKLDKILAGELGDYRRENIIVLDATTGQNALQQAKEFREVMHIDGIILTKLDGTAKGGIAVAITRELGVPVKYVGVGEGVNDLQRFDPDSFVESLFAE